MARSAVTALSLCSLCLASTACTTVTARTKSLTSAGAVAQVGFGVSHTSQAASGLGHSETFDDTRVDHAADVSSEGADRLWRVSMAPAALAQGVSGYLSQKLELCSGPPSALRSCKTATQVTEEGKTEEVRGIPALLEEANLGQSRRLTQVKGMFMGGTIEVSTRSGALREPASRRATPGFGVWILLSPVTATAGWFSVGTSGGPLLFCHVSDAAPRCQAVKKAPELARVLGVHTVQASGGFRHVVWDQARSQATYNTLSVPTNIIVRCEADDLGGSPSCQTVEVLP